MNNALAADVATFALVVDVSVLTGLSVLVVAVFLWQAAKVITLVLVMAAESVKGLLRKRAERVDVQRGVDQ